MKTNRERFILEQKKQINKLVRQYKLELLKDLDDKLRTSSFSDD